LPRARAQRAGQAGFSLLEVLVAFAILALTMGVLMQIFSRALSTTATSGTFARAADLAEATLARVGTDIPLEEGDYAEELETGFAWALRITRVDISELFPDQDPPVTPYRVTATAYWEDGKVERHFSLATLRLGDALETAGLGAGDVPARQQSAQPGSAGTTGSR
jgi:general secretion pathway protein I